jgi:hypothetical protein
MPQLDKLNWCFVLFLLIFFVTILLTNFIKFNFYSWRKINFFKNLSQFITDFIFKNNSLKLILSLNIYFFNTRKQLLLSSITQSSDLINQTIKEYEHNLMKIKS